MNYMKLIVNRRSNLFNLLPISSLLIGNYCDQVVNKCICDSSRLYVRDKKLISCRSTSIIFVSKRFKYKRTHKDEESEDEKSDDEDDGDSKLIIGHVNSLRVEAVLKAGLGMARNKVETSFYENKIRVNGRKILKKSHKVKVGDEVDIIKGKNRMNESLLDVSRIVLVSVKENEDSDRLKIKMKRYKTLAIEDDSEL